MIMLIVFLPTVDAGRVTIERIINGESPFKSDKNHFHHLLIKIFKKKYVFLPYIIFAILPYLTTKINVTTYISLIIFSTLYFLTLIFLKRKMLEIILHYLIFPIIIYSNGLLLQRI